MSLLFILIKKLNYCIMERKNENYVVLIVNRRNAEVKKEEIVALLKKHPEFKVLTGVLNSYFDSYVIVKVLDEQQPLNDDLAEVFKGYVLSTACEVKLEKSPNDDFGKLRRADIRIDAENALKGIKLAKTFSDNNNIETYVYDRADGGLQIEAFYPGYVSRVMRPTMTEGEWAAKICHLVSQIEGKVTFCCKSCTFVDHMNAE